MNRKEDIELKPCPYHGDPSAMRFSTASKKYACCEKCTTDKGGEWYRPVESWNNAWAWKEIEALKKENENLKRAIESWKKEEKLWTDFNVELKESLRREKEKSEKLLHALDRIRTIDSPVFNGERVTTINPYALDRWQKIAEEALRQYAEMGK